MARASQSGAMPVATNVTATTSRERRSATGSSHRPTVEIMSNRRAT